MFKLNIFIRKDSNIHDIVRYLPLNDVFLACCINTTQQRLILKSNFVKVENHLVCNWVYLKIQVIDKI
jgi:hypothetical protein